MMITEKGRTRLGRRWNLRIRAALAFLILITSTSPVFAWGRVGHRVCGKITEARLNPKARQEIRKLLDEGESLADASTWADENRDADRGSSTWHYVNVPINEASAYSPKYCSRGACVVSKIAEFRRVLADTKRPRAERQKALRYLVHFVQDVHQPMHVGDNRDKGGNDLQVSLLGDASNLHRVWDSGLLFRMGRNEDRHLARINPKLTQALEKGWAKGKVEDWASESLLLAKKAYIDPTTGQQLITGARLGEPYLTAHADNVDLRLMQAGVRLAMILNETFPDGQSSPGKTAEPQRRKAQVPLSAPPR